MELRGADGVWEKNLGVFGERRNEVRMLRLAAGGSLTIGTVGCIDLGFVITGTVTAGGQELVARDALSLAPEDAPVTLHASTGAELFWTVLPDFS